MKFEAIAHDDAESVSTAAGWEKRRQPPSEETKVRMAESALQGVTFIACRQKRPTFEIIVVESEEGQETLLRATWMRPDGVKAERFYQSEEDDTTYSLRMRAVELCFRQISEEG